MKKIIYNFLVIKFVFSSAILLVLFKFTLQAQDFEQKDVFISGTYGYDTYRIPSLVVTNKNIIIAFCEGRRNSKSDTGDIDVLAKRSSDGGKTWGLQQVIWDDGINTCGNPTAVVDRSNGVIWLLLTHNLSADSEEHLAQRIAKGTRTVWVCSSVDDGQHWSKPSEITNSTKKLDWGWYATGPGIGIQLEKGVHQNRLLIPCNHTIQPDLLKPEIFSYRDHIIYSDDHGLNWTLGGIVPWLDVDEPQAVELSNGDIMLNMRSAKKMRKRITAISRDSGESFTDYTINKSLPEPPCQASILRYTQLNKNNISRLLFSNPASAEKRVAMTVKMSYDEGLTWPIARTLHAGPSAYSVLTVLPSSKIACLYERGIIHPYERITFAQFSLSWLSGNSDNINN